MTKPFEVVAIKDGVTIESVEFMKRVKAKSMARKLAEKYIDSNNVDVLIKTTAYKDYKYLGMDGLSNRPCRWV